ncbi:hypothetical protein ABXN37_07985 [Piscinibacter sakaiensis]|uniref:Uncharacterized protein n=1 Tax=Piscinibacter sakaiensis TaxID=1547922 RepID=A0A0K8NYV3_PISS1|nr:hypothetical protein [Piscinibacter sakaiensis]GAP35095.1 hypothetical protein ISF6_0660 [Piscinibacter sakaiensis]
MSTQALRTAPANGTPLLAQAWHGLVVAVDAVLAARYNKAQIEHVEQLLRASNACEASNPARAEALRGEAAALIH